MTQQIDSSHELSRTSAERGVVDENDNAAARIMKVFDWVISFPLFVICVYKTALVNVLAYKFNYRSDTAEYIISNYWFKNPIWAHAIGIMLAILYADPIARYILLNQKKDWLEIIFAPISVLLIMIFLAWGLSWCLPSAGMDPNKWLVNSTLGV